MNTIRWTVDAQEDFWQNIDYLEKRWSMREAINFSVKVEELLEQLKINTATYTQTGYKDAFKIPVVKQVTLFYKLDGDKVILLRFWNNFQNPESLSL